MEFFVNYFSLLLLLQNDLEMKIDFDFIIEFSSTRYFSLYFQQFIHRTKSAMKMMLGARAFSVYACQKS